MKNLRKVLAFVITFTMVLGFAASAAVFPDVDSSSSYAEAVTILSSLGIMIGDDHGNFDPDNTIIRSEVAAIVVRAKGLGDAAAGAAGATRFSDVAGSHWASGYINLASQSGIINGFPDGTFRPDDAVTYEQVVKMIVAALGYTPMAEQMGGYPSGYLVIAAQRNINRGALAGAGEPAKRSIVARLTFNALDVDVMEQTGWNPSDPYYETMTGKTLLKDFLYVDKYEGIVEDTYITRSSRSDDDTIYIRSEKFNKEDIVSNETFREGDTNAAGLFGQYVVAYVSEDEYTGDLTLLAIAPKSGRNRTLTLDYSQLVEIPDNNPFTRINYYANSSDSSTSRINIASNYKIYWNGRTDDNDDADAFIRDADKAGKVEFIDYDNDDEYEIILVTGYEYNYVVKDVDIAAERVIDKDGSNVPIYLDDEEVITRFYDANGEPAAFEDIQEEDVLTLAESADGGLLSVFISKKVVEGTVTEKRASSSGDRYTIGGNEYRVYNDTAPSINVGDEGKFYLNIDNRIIHKDAISTVIDNYAYMLASGVTSGIGGAVVEVKFITSQGEWKTVKLANRVTVYTDGNPQTIDAYPKADGAVTIGNALKPLLKVVRTTTTTSSGTSETSYSTVTSPQLFQFQLNSAGDLHRVYVIDSNQRDNDSVFSLDRSENTAYRAYDNKIGAVYMEDNTIVFNVATADEMDEDDISVARANTVFKDGNDYEIDAYDITDGYPRVVVVHGAEHAIPLETNLLVINRVTQSNNENGMEVNKYYGLQNGVEVSGEASEDGEEITDRYNNALAGYSVKAGDVVIFSTDAKGKIDKVQVLLSLAEATALAKDNHASGVQWFLEDDNDVMEGKTIDAFGFVSRKVSGRLELVEAIGSSDVLPESFTVVRGSSSSANVYEVNLNRSNQPNPQKIDFGRISTENRVGRTGNWAYVRMYDGMVVDVVVYSLDNPA